MKSALPALVLSFGATLCSLYLVGVINEWWQLYPTHHDGVMLYTSEPRRFTTKIVEPLELLRLSERKDCHTFMDTPLTVECPASGWNWRGRNWDPVWRP